MLEIGAKRSISVTARSFSVIHSVVVTDAGHLERTVDRYSFVCRSYFILYRLDRYYICSGSVEDCWARIRYEE